MPKAFPFEGKVPRNEADEVDTQKNAELFADECIAAEPREE